TPCPILDSENRVAAFLAGQPRDESWDALVEEAALKVEEARGKILFTEKQLHHGRGDFPALSMGFAHGGGRKKPGNVYHTSTAVLTVITTLLALHCFQRIAGFANGKRTFSAC
ncbi:hypothetical protein K435DRAFT_700014, partial [Dendrothele bispora CBS 962.96]